MSRKIDEFKRGYYVHGSVRCDGCNIVIDLSDADTLEEASEIWNGHIREEHPEKIE